MECEHCGKENFMGHLCEGRAAKMFNKSASVTGYKACPFCGSEARTTGLKNLKSNLVSIYCDSCCMADTGFKPEFEAAEAWNKRAL